MSDVHIVFNKGQSESVDPKLLPDGVFSSIRNMRIRKDGRLESRWGYKTQAGAPADLDSAVRTFAHDTQLVSVVQRAGGSVAAYPIIQTDATHWPYQSSTPPSGISATTLGTVFAGVKRRTVFTGQSAVPLSTDCTVDANGYTWVVVAASTGTGFVYKIDASGLVVFSVALASGASNCRIMTIGTLVVVVYTEDGLSVVQLAINATLHTSTRTVVFSGIIPQFGYCFDVSAYSATEYALTMQQPLYPDGAIDIFSVVASTGARTLIVRVSVTGVTTLLLTGLSVHPTVDRMMLVLVDSSTQYAYAGLYQKNGTTVSALANVDTSGTVWGFPLAGVTGTTTVGGLGYVLNYLSLSLASRWCSLFKFGGTASCTAANMHAISRPALTLTSDSSPMFWAADTAPQSPETRTTYYLVGTRGNASSCTFEAVACQNDGYQPYLGGASVLWDPRRTLLQFASGDSLVALPVYCSQSVHGADLFRVIAGTDVGNAVKINGQSILPGAFVREWSGSKLVESGLCNGPRYVTATGVVGAGNVNVGVHQWVVVWEWRDEQGRVHRSPPCAPVTYEVLSSARPVDIEFDNPVVSAKGQQYGTTQAGIYASIYRTQAGGGVFYFVASKAVDVNQITRYTYRDNLSDSTIAANRVLYTQGARGALSGLLPNDPPPAARYACASATRVLLGGLENPSEVQWSKLAYPGEPIQWSIDMAYRARVEGEVTGVAVLDGTWVVFTRDAIWEVVGDGPDDTGVGSFQEPRRRPGTTGCINHRSIIECADGLLFQGTNKGIWLLPRGGNAPQWVGQAVREITGASLSCSDVARVDAENCIYWAFDMLGTNPYAYLVVFDTRNNEWYADPIGFDVPRLCTWNGQLTLFGKYLQQAGAYIDGTSTPIACSFTTGDLRPFGASGWGRCRLMHLLGEFATEMVPPTDSIALSVQISYDSGQSWTDTYSFTIPDTTSAGGDTVDIQVGPSRIRNTSYRIKVTATPTPAQWGLLLNALSLDLYKSAGLRRVAAAQRG